MEQPTRSDSPQRPDATALQSGWADKSDEIFKRKPLWRRDWFIRLAIVLGLLAVAVGGVGSLFLYRWHREQQADLARQRHRVEAFVQSPVFAAFAREVDAQFVATLNFAVLRPEVASSLLPDIAAAEKARHQVPWAIELSPVPVSTVENPARVQAAMRTATDLLAQRGFDFSSRATETRRTFLRLLAPHVRTFSEGGNGADFPALFLDRSMQRIVLEAYARRAGGTVQDAEHAFAFYALVGPALWREIGR